MTEWLAGDTGSNSSPIVAEIATSNFSTGRLLNLALLPAALAWTKYCGVRGARGGPGMK